MMVELDLFWRNIYLATWILLTDILKRFGAKNIVPKSCCFKLHTILIFLCLWSVGEPVCVIKSCSIIPREVLVSWDIICTNPSISFSYKAENSVLFILGFDRGKISIIAFAWRLCISKIKSSSKKFKAFCSFFCPSITSRCAGSGCCSSGCCSCGCSSSGCGSSGCSSSGCSSCGGCGCCSCSCGGCCCCSTCLICYLTSILKRFGANNIVPKSCCFKLHTILILLCLWSVGEPVCVIPSWSIIPSKVLISWDIIPTNPSISFSYQSK